MAKFDFGGLIGKLEGNNQESEGLRPYHFLRGQQYTAAEIYGDFEVRYSNVPAETLVIDIEPEMLQYIEVKVEHGKLTVRQKTKTSVRRVTLFSFKQRPTPIIHLHTPQLTYLHLHGDTIFRHSDIIAGEAFTLELKGDSQVRMHVNAGELHVMASGDNELDLAGTANSMAIESQGDNEHKITLKVASDLSVDCTGDTKLKLTGVANNATFHIAGDAEVDLDLVVARLLALKSSGDSDIHLSGITDYLELELRGDSDIEGLELDARDAKVTSRGDSRVKLTVMEVLDVHLRGDSQVYYNGNPTITQIIQGDAKLQRI